MSNLITEHSEYDAFSREWPGNTEQDTRMFWQLLGELAEDEVLIRIPQWLAEEKVSFVDGATPTEFVGRIERETEKAILFGDSASARPLAKLAHRIHHFEQGLENVEDDEDRRAWLERRLQEKRHEFDNRDDVTGLQDEWLPKSQIQLIVQRVE